MVDKGLGWAPAPLETREGRMKVPFELLVEAVHQQLMFLCVSALLMSDAGELALQFLQLVLSWRRNRATCGD